MLRYIYAMNAYTYLLDTVAVVYPMQGVPANSNFVWNPFYCCAICITVVGDRCGVLFVPEL